MSAYHHGGRHELGPSQSFGWSADGRGNRGADSDLYWFRDGARANPFWSHVETWNNIVNLASFATNPSGPASFTVDNSAWKQFGSFSTTLASTGSGVDRVVASPQPASSALAAVGAIVILGTRWSARAGRKTVPCYTKASRTNASRHPCPLLVPVGKRDLRAACR